MDIFLAHIDSKYCEYLQKFDSRVPYASGEKANRPFVGVVLKVGDIYYFAPLSSPKPKHKQMSNQIDVIKIDNGNYGVINLNNMLPVSEKLIYKIDVSILAEDSESEQKYKKLLIHQIQWCQQHASLIKKKANTLYNLITRKNAWPALVARCCDFANDEKRLIQYIHSQ